MTLGYAYGHVRGGEGGGGEGGRGGGGGGGEGRDLALMIYTHVSTKAKVSPCLQYKTLKQFFS